MTLEREVYSIETANINKETLDAMKNAGAAMKHIHAGLTIDKVDNVMCVALLLPLLLPSPSHPTFPYTYTYTHSKNTLPNLNRNHKQN